MRTQVVLQGVSLAAAEALEAELEQGLLAALEVQERHREKNMLTYLC